MPVLVAFASLPFGLREGTYTIETSHGPITAHISARRYQPFFSVGPQAELAESIPPNAVGDGLTTYTWYDHPFVLQVVFGPNVAALGSINSGATVVEPLDEATLEKPQALDALRESFCARALEAMNNLVAVVRRQGHIYHLFDLRRDDIDLTVRSDDGAVLLEDPLQEDLIRKEMAHSETFDLVSRSDAWYRELSHALKDEQPVDLADELLIEAERALMQRFPRQAIATCHTALEAASSSLLTGAMLLRGVDDHQVDQMLSTRNLTSKLGPLMGRYCGYNLRNENRTLWQGFGRVNDLRNDIVHRGYRPTHDDAEQALRITRSLLRWLRMVRQRNKVSSAPPRHERRI
jgi:hypothetical protein